MGLNDWLAIQQLQRRGVLLDLERTVLWPHTPLNAALAAHWPLSPIGAETIVLHPPGQRGRALGFVQARRRHRRPEVDLAYIAPALDARDDAVSIWYRLLAETTQKFGDRGIQRLFAQIASGNGAEEVLRQAGFTVYAHDDIYRLNERPDNLAKDRVLRHQRSRDTWNLLQLYSAVTPRPVQIAEGMATPEGRSGKLHHWWDQVRGSGYVLPVDRELAGAMRLQRGRSAYWLRFWLNPQRREYADALLQGALSILAAAPRRPIYCSVREYESGMRASLEAAGFRYLYSRSLLVKHTTVRIKEPMIKLVPALEKRAEPAASIAHHTETR